MIVILYHQLVSIIVSIILYSPLTNILSMIKELKRAYNYVVHVPHKESDWKIAIALGILMLAAIGSNF